MHSNFHISETFGASRIDYDKDTKGIFWSRVDNEPKALISGDSLQRVQLTTYARIRREAL